MSNNKDKQLLCHIMGQSDFLCHKMRWYELLGYTRAQAAKMAVAEWKRKQQQKK